MKKYLSFLMAFLMVFCLISASAVASFAEDADSAEDSTDTETPATPNPYVLYISDSGDDNNDGETADTPLRSWMALVNKMNVNVKGEYNCGEAVIVGTSSATIGYGTKVGGQQVHNGAGWSYPMTITSASKDTACLKIDGTFRIMGETLFTNLKIVGATGDGRYILYTDIFDATFGKEGVENDVICEGPVYISTGWPASEQTIKRDAVVTFNSGTYAYVYGEGIWGSHLTGKQTVVINGGTFKDGAITMGGAKGKTGSNGFFACLGDYTVEINGGTFENELIYIGWATGKHNRATIDVFPGTDYAMTVTKDTDDAINIFGGKVTLDINGGTFTNCNGKIGKGSTLDPDNCKESVLMFKRGVEINIGDIKNANKDAYKALVAEADKALLVEHNYDVNEPITGNDEKHKAKCDCGCDGSIEVAHRFDDGVVTKTASHTENGNTKYTCLDCGYEKNVAIQADPNNHLYEGAQWENHNETQHKRKCTDSTCTEYEYGNHEWDNGTVTKAATHTEEGVKTYTCTVCGGTKTEAIAKTEGHTMSDWTYDNETQHKRSCACGETKTGEHSWDAGVITKAATETEDGVKTYTCAVCGGTKTEVIPKTGTDEKEASGCGSSLSVGFALCLTVALGGTCVLSKKFKKD